MMPHHKIVHKAGFNGFVKVLNMTVYAHTYKLVRLQDQSCIERAEKVVNNTKELESQCFP